MNIIDNVLSENELTLLLDTINEFEIRGGASMWFGEPPDDLPTWWFDMNQNHVCKDIFLHLLKIASNYFDISFAAGYEAWTNINVRPGFSESYGWHQDKDERLYLSEGIIKFPICTLIYYPYIAGDITGGMLELKNETITPLRNRLVVFGPGLWHNVSLFSGKRISLVINPWAEKICQTKCYDPNI